MQSRPAQAPTTSCNSDGGKTFQAIAHPFGTKHFNLALSPTDDKTLVLWTDGNTDLQVTHDRGAAWQGVPLPEAQNTSLSGAGIDATGTLFLLRGDAFSSRKTY